MKRWGYRFLMLVILFLNSACTDWWWDWSKEDVILQEEVSPWGGHKTIVLLQDPGPLDSFYTRVEIEILSGPKAGNRILIFQIVGKPELTTEWLDSGELKIIGDFSNVITHKVTVFARDRVLYEPLSGTDRPADRVKGQ